MNGRPTITRKEEQFKPGDTCENCSFQVPIDARNPHNSMLLHIKQIHRGWAEITRTRPQFLALVEATGSFDLALHFADQVIMWQRPTDDTLKTWATEAEIADDEGKVHKWLPTEKQVNRMARKLRAAQEWDARKTNAINRKVVQMAGGQFIDGKIQIGDMSTAYRYIGDTWHWGEKAVKEAYGATRESAPPMQQTININAGPPPPPRLKAPVVEDVIEAEFTVRESVGHSDPA